MPNADLTIGVFDSGVGGLTVLRELLRQVPAANYLYFGDTARLPYGSKSVETVQRYAVGAAQFLEQRGLDMLVIACNTATALALDAVTAAVKVPVVGVVEPGAANADKFSKSRCAVVIGTEATVKSHAYQRALTARGLKAREKACPLLVPLVEEGWTEHAVTEQVARIYLGEIFAEETIRGDHSDVLVLGCTHYPLLKPMLKRIVPEEVSIIDSAQSVAGEVADKLGVKKDSTGSPQVQAFVTDSVDKFQRLGTYFLRRVLEDVQHVDLGG
jgi:glutamate racemase